MTEVNRLYDELFHLDLCVLAYQLYHQSVIWPLDPWYESLWLNDLTAHRRSLFMKQVRGTEKSSKKYWNDKSYDGDWRLYGGPAGIRHLGTTDRALDPIITNYGQIDPHHPGWSRDADKFVAMKAPGYVTDPIKVVEVATRKAGKDRLVNFETLVEHESGTDHLIAFEGGTGSLDNMKCAWSLMGYVLARKKVGSNWDAHIVFRGSRSGSIYHEMFSNPDWKTDLLSRTVVDKSISGKGKVARGFAATVATCLPGIKAALKALYQSMHGAPQRVTVTGHSLGGGLAAQTCAAIALGTVGRGLKSDSILNKFPWDNTKGYFFAEPPVGSTDMASAFNKHKSDSAPSSWADRCRLVYVKGDPVTEAAGNVHLTRGNWEATTLIAMMGPFYLVPLTLDQLKNVKSHLVIGTPKMLSYKRGKHNPHEILMIREGILEQIKDKLKQIKGNGKRTPLTELEQPPWGTYKSLYEMVTGGGSTHSKKVTKVTKVKKVKKANLFSDQPLHAMLKRYHFKQHFDIFLELLQRIVLERSTYGGLIGDKKKREERAKRLRIAIGFSIDPNGLAGQERKDFIVKAVGSKIGKLFDRGNYVFGENVDRYIGLGMVLSEMEENPQISLKDFLKNKEIKLCIEAKWV